MFKGQRQEPQQFPTTKHPSKSSNTPKVALIHRVHKLLENNKRQDIVKQFPAMLSLSFEKYEVLCRPLIENFLEFVQGLPETLNSYFAHDGGMADHALERTAAALSLCRAYFIQDEQGEATEGTMQLSEPQTLWMYTLFSAAILHGIGKVYVDLIVELYDHDAKYLQRWLPFDGPMYRQGSHYDYDFEENNDEPFRKRVTLLLARQLIPEEGFKWIASDKDVLAVWLALLDDDQRAAGTLGLILNRADALAINNHFNEKRIQREFIAEPDKTKYPLMKTVLGGPTPGGDAPINPAEATIGGVEFLKWLSKSLVSERLLINQKPLFVVPGGLLLSKELFQKFIAEHPEFKDWQKVQASFLALKVHQATPAGATQNFIQISNKHEINGVVLSNINLVLPEKFKVKSLTSGETFTSNPHAFSNSLSLQSEFAKCAVITEAHNPYLDVTGKWQAQTPAGPAAGPNNKIGH